MSAYLTARSRALIATPIAALTLAGGALTGYAVHAPAAHAAPAGSLSSLSAGSSGSIGAQEEPAVDPEVELNREMRTLWAQHMEWTYDVVVAFANDEGLDPTMERLLSNQDDIGDAFRPYYGDAAADELTALLREHIEFAVPVLEAAEAGDDDALDDATAAWYGNAEEIGDFLVDTNAAWEEARDIMEKHIDHTIEYAGDVLGGDYEHAVEVYDHAQQHMLELGDVISDGLVADFPERF